MSQSFFKAALPLIASALMDLGPDPEERTRQPIKTSKKTNYPANPPGTRKKRGKKPKALRGK